MKKVYTFTLRRAYTEKTPVGSYEVTEMCDILGEIKDTWSRSCAISRAKRWLQNMFKDSAKWQQWCKDYEAERLMVTIEEHEVQDAAGITLDNWQDADPNIVNWVDIDINTKTGKAIERGW